MINYIEILSNKTIKIYKTKQVEVLNLSFEKYLNVLLLKDLTTFNGRIEAIKKKYKYKKLVPIYIDDTICFIPVENIEYNSIYINAYSIYKITYQKIIFIDGSSLSIYKNLKTISNNINRAKAIKK